jgi:N-dimethylarginine dimethylaminohydrolase
MAVVRRALGFGLGLVMGAASLAFTAPLPAPRPPAAPTPRPPAAVETWVLHYTASGDDVCGRTYSDLLAAIGPRARVHVAVATERDVAAFRGAVVVPDGVWDRVSFFVAGPSVSLWARDRYVVFRRRGMRCILLPAADSVVAGWRSDLDVGAELALDRSLGLRRIATPLAFEGGDLVFSDGLLLTGIGTLEENARLLHVDEEGARQELAHAFGRRVIVLGSLDGDPPHEHADMYVHALDDRRVLLGDPSLAARAWETMAGHEAEKAQMDLYGPCSRGEQEAAAPAYERVAIQLRAAGLEVVRVPALHARYGDVLLTWTNAVTEWRGGAAHAYVPSYGLPTLDRQAQATWKRLGYVVHPIDCSGCIVEGGGIRCLTNTVRVSAGRSAPAPVQNAPAGRDLRLLEPAGR